MQGSAEFRDEVIHRSGGNCPLGNVFRRGHLKTSYGLERFRSLPHFAIVYILAGEGYFESNSTNRIRVESGDFLLLLPNQPHRYGPIGSSGWSEIYLLFDGPVFHTWLSAGILTPDRPVLHAQPIERWARRMSEILPSQPEMRLSSKDALSAVCRVQNLLADLLCADQANVDNRSNAWHQQACALLQELPYPGQAAIARQLGCSSVDAFRKRFQKLSGVAPNRYRQISIAEQACRLLQSGQLRDHQIADRLGFHDAAHFSKFFKAHCGQTPTAFRQSQPMSRAPKTVPISDCQPKRVSES